jgi:ATPase family associated with various cellular activities (AAA)
MLVDEVFEARIDAIVQRAATAAGTAPPDAPAPPPDPPTAPVERGARELALRDQLGIDDDALDFVWSLVARAVEPRLAAYLRAVWGNEARIGVSLAQHLALGPLPARRRTKLLEILDPIHPLRAAGILATSDDVLDVGTRWTVSQRVWRFLAGDDALDPEVARVGGAVALPMFCALTEAHDRVIDQLGSWLASREPLTIVLDGAIGSGRRTAVALATDRPVVAIDAALLSPGAACHALLALRREVALRDATPIVANLDELWSSLPPRDSTLLAFAELLDRFPMPVVITVGRPGIEVPTRRRAILRQGWPLPDAATRRTLWARTLDGAMAEDQLDSLSMRYALGAGGIEAAVAAARHRSRTPGSPATSPSYAHISAGVQDSIAERLGELAQRVVVRQRWDELMLPPDTMDDVRMLIARIRHSHHVLETWNFKQKLARGTGVAALFSGPPGTGKTMVAGLIARELDLELYQVDLSRIVSKWVGETEKQLAKVFEAAEAGHALLLFDEADALFAKRSAEVKSAVDRYANLEVNYLLQRVESFGGVVILTTNLDNSIDPALRRRLASHIVFGQPERAEQIKLWHSMLATGAPLEPGLDIDDLVEEFEEMSGANIRNAVLAAAFLASEEGTVIGFEHLRRAARGEYRAMGHVLGRDSRARKP